jgi:hypothetical protein
VPGNWGQPIRIVAGFESSNTLDKPIGLTQEAVLKGDHMQSLTQLQQLTRFQ